MGISATRVRHPGSILGAISHSLEYHDLLKVPRSGREDCICWLRFYRGDPCVAIVTNVPGNSAYSVTNMVSKVADHIARRFSVDIAELVLFEIWPRIESREPKIQRVTFTSDGKEKPPSWRKSRDRSPVRARHVALYRLAGVVVRAAHRHRDSRRRIAP